MARLLYISASPREAASESLRTARVFTGTYQDAHPGDEVEHWDLWDGSLLTGDWDQARQQADAAARDIAKSL